MRAPGGPKSGGISSGPRDGGVRAGTLPSHYRAKRRASNGFNTTDEAHRVSWWQNGLHVAGALCGPLATRVAASTRGARRPHMQGENHVRDPVGTLRTRTV